MIASAFSSLAGTVFSDYKQDDAEDTRKDRSGVSGVENSDCSDFASDMMLWGLVEYGFTEADDPAASVGRRLRGSILQRHLDAAAAAGGGYLQPGVVEPSHGDAPAQMGPALSAFRSKALGMYIGGSFCAWRDFTRSLRRNRATMSWFMERMALTEKNMILQEALWAWYHLIPLNRQPAWATKLKQDLEDLTRSQSASTLRDERSPAKDTPPEETPSADVGMAKIAKRVCVITAAVCVCTLLLNVVLRGGQPLDATTWAPANALFHAQVSGPDTDGDGVADAADSCPWTSNLYNFQSTWRTDWDSDGCMDSVEDQDDDGDKVPNSQDSCPRTRLGTENVDSEGCTPGQKGEDVKDVTSSSSWGAKLGDIFLEIVVGLLFTASVNYASSQFGGRTTVCRKFGGITRA